MRLATTVFLMSLFGVSVATTSLANEQITITTGKTPPVKAEQEQKQERVFCSATSGDDAKKQCETWMTEQKTSLGARFLTSFCEFPVMSKRQDGCLHESKGELRYILKLCQE